MKWNFGIGLALVFGLGLAELKADPLQKQVSKPKPSQLMIGLPKTLFRGVPEGALKLANKPFQSLIQDQTGMTGQVVNTNDAMEMAKQLSQGDLHLGVFHGFEFAWAQSRHPKLEPLVIAVPHIRETQVYFIVPATGKYDAVSQLKGKPIGIPGDSKDHVLVFWDKLLQADLGGLENCKVRKVISSVEALHEVVDGELEATLVDSASFISFEKECPGRARKLRILQKSDIFPPAVIAYCKDCLDDDGLKRCRDGLIGAGRNPKATFMLNLIKLKGFEEIPTNYCIDLKKSIQLYPNTAIERISFDKLVDK